MPTAAELADAVRGAARSLGFDLVGVAPATEADGFDRFRDWLAQGYAGSMEYLHKHADARRHPASVFASVRSVVMLGTNYAAAPEPAAGVGEGRVARYARGPDYHDTIRGRLNTLMDRVRAFDPSVNGRGVIDTAPLLERDFARRAGLGWVGKNTMLIHPRRGSYLFLAALLLDVELPADEPFAADHCGSCTACLEACPTGAFPLPRVLDASRCVSYLTIERREPVPEHLRDALSGWLFGCDVCQEVCPWNRRPPDPPAALPHDPDLARLPLAEVLALDDAAFRARFRGTALFRTKRAGLVRSAALLAGTQGDPSLIPLLGRLREDADAGVRDAACWALGRLSPGGEGG